MNRESHQKVQAVLEERSAPILNMSTPQFGRVFGEMLGQYEGQQMDFKGGYASKCTPARFTDELYTDHSFWPSLAHRDVIHKAVTPIGGAEATDKIHLALRNLGWRIASVFTPAAESFIGEEAQIRIEHTKKLTRKRVVTKDRPPNADAIQTLEAVDEFIGILTDTNGNIHPITLENYQTEYLGKRACVLETALALREQARDIFGSRNHEVFTWVRDRVSMQSTDTLMQMLAIIQEGMKEQYPENILADFRLEIPLHARLQIAEIIFRKIHEIRREEAIERIIHCGDSRESNLLARSVGESADGFHIRSPVEAAAVTYAMQVGGDFVQFCYPKEVRSQCEFPINLRDQIITIANSLATMRSLKEVSAALAQHREVLQRAQEWYNQQAITIEHPQFNQKHGINLALELLHQL